ncbi:MAG TPA: class I SAM-dependent rRNA methyltransferase [Bacilli bacterium]
MATVYLNRQRKKRLEQGKPWVFDNEVQKIEGEVVSGQLVTVVSHLGQFLAVGYINPLSKIIVRIVSYEPLEQMDQTFFIEKFRKCQQHRERFLEDPRSCRVVYGEADFLPGLIVDRFADVLVVQILTLGMDIHREDIVAALIEVFQPKGIYERSDVQIRELEGLPLTTGVLYGDCPRHVMIVENELQIQVDIWEGQKTGYFFDQRENRRSIGPLMTGWGKHSGITVKEVPIIGEGEVQTQTVPVNSNGKIVTYPYWDGAEVLECFSHSGSFTLNACNYGAKKVTCLDISEHAIESAKHNVKLNGFEDRVEFVVADAFDYLRRQVKGLEERNLRGGVNGGSGNKKIDTSIPMGSDGRTWDVVILDPPAFAKTKSAIQGACRGYKDINLHAMKLIKDGGYLVTASCSYHIRPDLFLETILEAAVDANKILRLVEFRGAGKDHPQILGVDEGHYLKFAIFEVQDRK